MNSLEVQREAGVTLSCDTMSASADADAATFKVVGQLTPLQAQALALLSLKPTSL